MRFSNHAAYPDRMHGTTILALHYGGKVVLAGDGQITLNNTVIKHHARKVRRIHNDQILVGFAGATADAMNLSERLEGKLERYNGNLTRSVVELAKDWRTDKYLRRLEALMLTADREKLFLVSGNGDVIEPDEGVIAIGSGGVAAQAAATALIRNTQMDALQVAEAAMQIASGLCVYTNQQLTFEELTDHAKP